MKAALPLLLSATLASAQAGFNTSAAANSSDVSNIQFNGNGEFNLADFNLGDLNLNELEAGGLNLGNIDLGDQDAIAEAILAMLNNLCLGNALDLNKILSFGFNNDVDLFFQLAQLEQLEQLGFLNLGGIQSLFSKGLALGGFNLGVFKREIAEARKTMKRTKLRRGQKIKRQCPESGIALGAAEENTFTIATSTTTAAAAAATTEEIAFTIATADPDAPVASSVTVAAAATTSVTSAASVASASSTASSAAVSVAPAAGAAGASAASAASTSAVPAAAASAVAAAPAAAVPAAAATSAAAAGAGDVENLSDLTR
ncbi:hypothetical protein N656DRAFT_802197 [Canariomyces notabilis]|uniref:Uncharacterized protein n=1 Tax=Canariomyces notabilis TaxID=2074819 RepID=A0AAN6T8M8_9PEZI|nr:hypothetical protein N656DRAFT_802197 [Canariomyces arenarius]